jgi:hypothetical protein
MLIKCIIALKYHTYAILYNIIAAKTFSTSKAAPFDLGNKKKTSNSQILIERSENFDIRKFNDA